MTIHTYIHTQSCSEVSFAHVQCSFSDTRITKLCIPHNNLVRGDDAVSICISRRCVKITISGDIVWNKSLQFQVHTVDPMLLPSGNPFKCHGEVLYLQPMIPPKRYDIFPPDWGCSEGLDAFRFFFQYCIGHLLLSYLH